MFVHTEDLEAGMEVVIWGDLTRCLTSWEWGLYDGKLFKRWYGHRPDESFSSLVNNQPHEIQIVQRLEDNGRCYAHHKEEQI